MASPQHAREEQIVDQANHAYDVLMEQIRGIFSHEVPSLATTDMAAAQSAIEQVRQADHDLMKLVREAESND